MSDGIGCFGFHRFEPRLTPRLAGDIGERVIARHWALFFCLVLWSLLELLDCRGPLYWRCFADQAHRQLLDQAKRYGRKLLAGGGLGGWVEQQAVVHPPRSVQPSNVLIVTVKKQRNMKVLRNRIRPIRDLSAEFRYGCCDSGENMYLVIWAQRSPAICTSRG
jgi:hypothetical protein